MDEVSPPIKAKPAVRWWLQKLLQTIEKWRLRNHICPDATSPPAPWAGPGAILTSPKPELPIVSTNLLTA